MKTVIYRQLRESELAEASRQLTASYRAAYRGLMDEAYLTSLQEDHWVEILQASMERGDICLVAEDGEAIVGAAVCGRSEERGDQACAELYAIYLLPEYTGHGVGHGLYCEIEARMRAQGFRCSLLPPNQFEGKSIFLDNFVQRRFLWTEIPVGQTVSVAER